MCYETVLNNLQHAIADNASSNHICDADAINKMHKLAAFFYECTEPMAKYREMLQTSNTIVNQAKQQDTIDMYAKQIINICVAYGLDTPQVPYTPSKSSKNTDCIAAGICSSCMTTITVDPCCPNCGLQLVSVASRHHTGPSGESDIPPVPVNQQGGGSADTRDHRLTVKQRRSHFQAFLAQYQGKGTRVIPVKVIAHVRERLHATHLVSPNNGDIYANVSRAHINAILRSTKHNSLHKYYKDVGRIHAIITGQKSPDLSGIETRLTLMFVIGFFLFLCMQGCICSGDILL